ARDFQQTVMAHSRRDILAGAKASGFLRLLGAQASSLLRSRLLGAQASSLLPAPQLLAVALAGPSLLSSHNLFGPEQSILIAAGPLLHQRLCRRLADHVLAHQLPAVNVANARMCSHLFIHHRLSIGRLVSFVMPVAPESDQVDHHVLMKPLS